MVELFSLLSASSEATKPVSRQRYMGEKTSKTIQQNRCQFLVTELLFTDYMKIVL